MVSKRESVDGVAKGQPRWVQEKRAQAGDVLGLGLAKGGGARWRW